MVVELLVVVELAKMSLSYQAVAWNPAKRRYDLVIAGVCFVYLIGFLGVGVWVYPDATMETLLIRAFGALAFLLLHGILAIGPLCRLDARFLPLLYNRRHLGVTMFVAALVHGLFALVQFHAFGNVGVLESLFDSGASWVDPARFPFQIVGAMALAILFAMAATSHDYWLNLLGAPAWKRLHMGVYFAYSLLFAHVAFGALQSEKSPVYLGVFVLGAVVLSALHVAAGLRGGALDRERGFAAVCAVNEIPEGRAKMACIGGERVAIFRHGDLLSAVSNLCQHQNGPLGEGKIVDGCIVCPWHGYQYLPESGTSPPPFTEKIATYDVAVRGGMVFVNPKAYAPGTFRPAARIPKQ